MKVVFIGFKESLHWRQGVHTSAATVAVLPEVEEVDLKIRTQI